MKTLISINFGVTLNLPIDICSIFYLSFDEIQVQQLVKLYACKIFGKLSISCLNSFTTQISFIFPFSIENFK